MTFSKTFDDHLIHFQAVFERLKTANIKIKTSKCHIASDNIMFLGYRITSKGVCIDDSRIKVIKNYPKPSMSKNVKVFLGLTGYYRQFIRDYADLTEPLNKLTRKNVKFTWCDRCESSFQSLIKSLSEKPILAFPNFDAPFYLSTDASQVGIGAVLSQRDEHQREHPVYYASRSLTDAERRYSTIERELLAIIYSTEKFKYYLSGRKFTIITDHNPLVYLNSIKISSDRLTRWRLKLAEFDFNIIYRKGKANANADAMSRINIDEKPERIMDVLHTLFSISPEQIDSISNTKLLTAISSIVLKDDKLNYSDQDILSSSPDIPIVVCIPSDLNLTGLTRSICETYGLFPRLKRHNWKLGDCFVERGTRTVLFLVTKRRSSDPSSLDHLESSLRKLVELCNEQQIKQLAFAKYERGLDKLNWTHVSELLNRCFTDSIKCTILFK